MIPYLLYVALLLAVCLAFYKLLLQSETFYRLNRLVLLACLAISFALPLIPVPQQWSMQLAGRPAPVRVETPGFGDIIQEPAIASESVAPAPALKQKPLVASEKQPAPRKMEDIDPPKPSFHLSLSQVIKWLFVLYWAGVAIFGLNLLIQLSSTLYRAYTTQAITDGRYRIIDLATTKVPCSFLNNIFINPEVYDWDTYNQILTHEKVHVRQLHSIDILLAEVVIMFQWFNPFAWLYRKEIENNLEYLTDQEVLADQTIDPSAYQVSLVKVTAPYLSLSIATNYNQSLLKKRIKMMNARKSNFHTLWKYFMLLPLFGVLACAFNETAQSKELKTNDLHSHSVPSVSYSRKPGDTSESFWYAVRVGDTIQIDFKVVTGNHTWNNGTDRFSIKQISPKPINKTGDFVITREAGTMILNGKFYDDQGLGHFILKPDSNYLAYFENVLAQKIDIHDALTLFGRNIKKNYLKSMINAGLTDIKINQLVLFAMFNFTADDAMKWKRIYPDAKSLELMSIAAYHVSPQYALDIKKIYPDISIYTLSEFAHDKVDLAYIKSTIHDQQKNGKTTRPDPRDILNAHKYIGVDSAYLKAMTAAGMWLNPSDVNSFKSLGLTPDYIAAIRSTGYKNSDPQGYKMMYMAKVTPDFIKQFYDIGYNDLTYEQIVAFKQENVTPKYILGFKESGYPNIDANAIIWARRDNLTTDYIQSLRDLGYKDIDIKILLSLSTNKVTPDFIKGFTKLGFDHIPIDQVLLLKTNDVTPEYVSAMQQKGLNSTDIRKYITLKNSFN